MNAQPKPRPDDTRERIIETADALFRRLGFAKTTVADIASELNMSPANVYRFFSSKNAIVQAICSRCLKELEETAWAVGRASGSGSDRVERLVLEVLAYHKENLLVEKRVHDIVLVAIEDNWDAIQAHKETIRTVFEVILRDGIASGEFEPLDPHPTSRMLMQALLAFMHPVMVAQCLADEPDIEAAARASVRFVLRAVTPRG